MHSALETFVTMRYINLHLPYHHHHHYHYHYHYHYAYDAFCALLCESVDLDLGIARPITVVMRIIFEFFARFHSRVGGRRGSGDGQTMTG